MFNRTIERVFIFAIYIFVFFYFILILKPGVYYFTQQPAFLIDYNFLYGFLKYPGGIAEYLSLFIEQLFKFPFIGGASLLLVISLSAYISLNILKELINKEVSLIIVFIYPVLISMVLWHNILFPFSMHIKLLISLAFIRLLQKILDKRLLGKILGLSIMAILLYIIAGPIFLYLFLISGGLIILFNQEKQKFAFFIVILFSLIVIFIFQHTLYTYNNSITWFNYTPHRAIHLQYQPTWIDFLFIAYLPVFIIATIFSTQLKSERLKRQLLFGSYIVLILFAVFGSIKFNNKHERLVAKIAYAAYNENYKNVFKLVNRLDTYDRFANFYIYQALYYTGNLSKDLFKFSQLSGKDALFVDEPFGGNICMPASYLYYNLGLINIALRYAFEAHTLLPESPYVLMQIIDCLIILNDYQNAQVYINLLKRNILYKGFVSDRESFIKGKGSPKLKEMIQIKRSFLPNRDFFTYNPLYSLMQLNKTNIKNRMAYEYMMTYFILNKQIDNIIVTLLQNADDKETRIPPVYQEVILFYNIINKDHMVNNFSIDKDIAQRFAKFMKLLGTDKNASYRLLKRKYSDTFWFYAIYETH